MATAAMLLVTTGCQVALGALSPHASAQRSVESNPNTNGAVDIVSRRPWERGVVVLYRTTRESALGPAPLPVFGYEIVERRANGWWSIGGGSGSSRGLDTPDRFVTSGVGGGGGNDGSAFTIVSGEVLVPDVEAVEVTFANGQVLRDATMDDAYAVTVPEQTAACELRVVGAQDQVLETIDLAALDNQGERCSE